MNEDGTCRIVDLLCEEAGAQWHCMAVDGNSCSDG